MVINMTNKNIYNLFLFLSTLTRNLIEVFSVILLYNKGYNLNNILIFLLVTYISGIIVNYISLKSNYKIVLILSFLLYGISYLYLTLMKTNFYNLILFAILLSISSNSYHAIRHYLAMSLVSYNKGKNINIILIMLYISTIISNILGIILIKKIPIIISSIIIIVLSILSIFPILKFSNIPKQKINYKNIDINKKKIIYSILEQFKVILVELQPLYIYLYIKASITYVGIFNIIINIASLIVMLIISNRINNKYFKYINLLLGFILLIKLNLNKPLVLLLVALGEGIGMKLYEKNSLDNLYNIKNKNIVSYLIIEELIFFITKSILMLIFIIIIRKLKIILYICITGLIASDFFLESE